MVHLVLPKRLPGYCSPAIASCLAAVAILGAFAAAATEQAEASCRTLLVTVAMQLDQRAAKAAAKSLKQATAACRESGYWWLLHGWSEHLRGRDGQSSWQVAQDLYAPGPEEIQPGTFSAFIKERETDNYDFADSFAFPLYSRVQKGSFSKAIRQALSPLVNNTRKAIPLESYKGDFVAMAVTAAADFVEKLAPETATANSEVKRVLSRFESATSNLRASRNAWEAVHGALASQEIGPFLTGLYLAQGASRLCFWPPHPHTIHAWRFGPVGEPLQMNVREGTLLLFHRSLRLADCRGENQSVWVAFDVWVRSPQVEDAGNQEGGLEFFDQRALAKKQLKLLVSAPPAKVTFHWPTPLRIVRLHYIRSSLLNSLRELPVEWFLPVQPPVIGMPEMNFWCPEGRMSVLELPGMETVREMLLTHAFKFLREHLGGSAILGDLNISVSTLCRLSGSFSTRLEFPFAAEGLLRGALIVDAPPSYEKRGVRKEMPVKFSISPGVFGMGVYSPGFEKLLSWPFAPLPVLYPRVPVGGLLMMPRSTRLSILPYEQGSLGDARLLLFDVSLKVPLDSDSKAHEAVRGQAEAHMTSSSLDEASMQDGTRIEESEMDGAQHREEVIELFATLVHTQQFKSKDASALNTKLAQAVLHSSKESPGATISNVGGWQSDMDWLMTAPYKQLHDLRQELQDAVFASLLSELPASAVANLDLRLTGWSNLNQRNNSNAVHHHSDLDWRISGAYYVDVGAPSPEQQDGGLLQFWDPRLSSLAGRAAQVWKSGEPYPLAKVKAKPGLLIMFPSWLEHFVLPHLGKKPRITISFNIAAYWQEGGNLDLLKERAEKKAQVTSSGRHVKRMSHALFPSRVVHRTCTAVECAAAARVSFHSTTCPSRGDEASCSKYLFRDWASTVEPLRISVERAAFRLLGPANASLDGAVTWHGNFTAHMRGAATQLVSGGRSTSPTGWDLPLHKHRMDALMWGVAILGVESAHHDNHGRLSQISFRFQDPRPLGRNLEHLRANASASGFVRGIRQGSVVVFPPWLRGDLVAEEPGVEARVTLLPFDIHCS